MKFPSLTDLLSAG